MTSFPAIGPSPNLTRASLAGPFSFRNLSGLKKPIAWSLSTNLFELPYTTGSC
jgi:hypothetical protein